MSTLRQYQRDSVLSIEFGWAFVALKIKTHYIFIMGKLTRDVFNLKNLISYFQDVS